jgi:hypothetical protein
MFNSFLDRYADICAEIQANTNGLELVPEPEPDPVRV